MHTENNGKEKINKILANLRELHNEFPLRLGDHHKYSNNYRVTPEYPIEYLQQTNSSAQQAYYRRKLV